MGKVKETNKLNLAFQILKLLPATTLTIAQFSLCPSINGLFAQSLRYAQKIILRISNICLWLFLSHAPPGRRPLWPEA